MKSSQSNTKHDNDDDDDDDDDDDLHDATLLHGSPSKKDFLDRIKQFKQKDEEIEIEIATDHDLQMYTSTPIVRSAACWGLPSQRDLP